MAKSKKKKTKVVTKKSKSRAKPAPKSKAAAKSTKARVRSVKPKTARKAIKKPKPVASASQRVAPMPSVADIAMKKALDRIRPLLRAPLDPRVKVLVDVLGVDAVTMLMDAARKKADPAHRMELEQMLSAMAGRAAPVPHGSWVWHELTTTDPVAAKRFYRELLGWHSQDVEMMPGFHYTTFINNGVDVAGMMSIVPEQGDTSPMWGTYVKVDDVDFAADKAEALGGQIVVPAHDIPVGRWAMVKDPSGATVCLYRARS